MVQRTRRYLIRRVVVVLLTLFVVSLLSFLLMRLSPREIPKSMWSASTTQSKYCTGSGLSRPSMTRASSICS